MEFFKPTILTFLTASSLMLSAVLLVWHFDRSAGEGVTRFIYIALCTMLVIAIAYAGLELIRLGV